MPLLRQDAERGLSLLWEFLPVAYASECTQGFSQAISGLHLFLTDVLPASQPCIRAKVEGGVIEIRPREDTPVRLVDLEVTLGDKLGMVLDSINVEGLSGVSPIVVSLVSPGSVAARDGRLGRGDQLLEINGHSLRLATLERARWLLDSAARQGMVSLATLPFALLDGLKHSVSRQDLLSLTPVPKQKRSRSLDNISKIRRPDQAQPSGSHSEVKRSKTDVATRNRPLVMDPRFTPSIGSRSSNRSVVSSTVEVAAHLARSSGMVTNKAGYGAFKKRKVRKMHIMKGDSGLGIRIVGGKGSKLGDMGIFVNQLEAKGAASLDGRMKPGDELLMVDGKSLVGLTHAEAVDVLKSSQRLVQLVVATEDDGDSRASSVQSIPELISGQRKGHTSREVAPELVSSPNRNAFEMALLKGEPTGPQPLTAETELTESPANQSDKPRVLRSLTVWGPDSEPLSPPPEPPIKTIVFIKSSGKSLGFSIAGGKGGSRGDSIYVRNIDPVGPAAQDGRLKMGDEILEVNSQQLKGCTHQEAANIIKGLKSDVFTMVVRSCTAVRRSSSIRGTEMEVVLEKLPQKPLGIQLAEVQERDKCAVFVRNMAPGSVAGMSGKLALFDQIVRVSGTSVLGMRTHEVRSALTAAPAGEMRVGVVRPRDPAAVKKAIIEQEKLQKRDSSPTKTSKATPSPAPASGLFAEDSDSEGRVSESELDSEDIMDSNKVYKARSRVLSKAPKLSLDEALSLQQGDISAVKALNKQLREKVKEVRAAANGSPPQRGSPPSRGSPLPLPTFVTSLTPPQGFTQLEVTLRKPLRSRLGINLVEAKGSTIDVFLIRRMMPGGVAVKDGRLKLGDRLAELNGKSLQGLTLAKVLQEINDVPKYCHFVIWRDPNFTSLSSHGGSRTSLASTEEETKKVEGRRHSSQSYEKTPISGVKRLSLELANSPGKARNSLTVGRGESPLRFKRWSTTEGTKVDYGDIDTSSLDKYFPLALTEDDQVSSGSATPVPSLPAALPPSLPSTPVPTPPGSQTPPSTPPLESPGEMPALPTSLPPVDATKTELPELPVFSSQEDEPQIPTSLPPVEEMPPLPPVEGVPSLPLAEDVPQLPSSFPPEEDMPPLPPVEGLSSVEVEPQLPSSLPPEEDMPPLPPVEDLSSVEVEPRLPSSPPPEEDVPLEDVPPLPPVEDAPQVPSSMPPEDVSLVEDVPPLPPVEDVPEMPSSMPPVEDMPKVPSSMPPVEDVPKVPSSMPPLEDVPSLPPVDGAPQVPSSMPPKEDMPQTEDEAPESLPPEVPNSLPPTVEPKLPMEVSKDETNKPSILPSTLPPVAETTPKDQTDSSRANDSSAIPKGRQESGPFEVTLHKSMFKLGLQLLTDEMGMIAVKKVAVGSVVSRNGNIKVGDQILSVNDTSFVGKSLPECEKILKSLSKGQVKLVAMVPPKNVTGGGLKSEKSVYTGVSVSRSGRQLVSEEGVVKVELNCYGKKTLGLEIEGGIDTPLQYAFISHIIPGSPAFESGVFRKGDQLVMVGEECMIGLTHKEVLRVVKKVKETVEVVAQRKESPRQTRKPDAAPAGSEPEKESLEIAHKPSVPTVPIPDLTSSDLDSKKDVPEQAVEPSVPTSDLPDSVSSYSKKESPEQAHKPIVPTSPIPDSVSSDSKKEMLEQAIEPSVPKSASLDSADSVSKKESPEQMHKPSAPSSPVPELTTSDSKNESPKQTHEPSIPASAIPDSDSSDSRQESPEQIHKPAVPAAPIPVLVSSDSKNESPKQTHEPSIPTSAIPDSDGSDLRQETLEQTRKPTVQDSNTNEVLDTKTSVQAEHEKQSTPQPKVPKSSMPGSKAQPSDNRYSSLDRDIHLTSPSHHSTKAKSVSDLRRSRENVGGVLDVVPEETLTIELHRSASEKMGLAITGGSDNPRLQEVHVKQVVPDCVAHRDGRLKRGDRIVSVNGQSLAGLTNKEALKILKEAGLDITLVVARKIGRRTSTVNTPFVSTFHSRRGSGDNSQQGSNAGSRGGSPTRKRKHSSGENSRGGSKGSSPKNRRSTISQRRRESVSFGERGESKTSTLPRQLSSTIGVKLVELQKGPTGIGMQLHGGKEGTKVPITVKSVFPGGSAYKSGKIRAGDVILEANGISFENLTHEQAIATMKGFPQGKITLIVRDRSVVAGH